MTEEVRAAGGLVLRTGDDGSTEVLVVHRPKYDDWSFPKGKLLEGELSEAAALREVAEETGLRAELGSPLPPVRYVDNRGRPKTVRYWTMSPVAGRFEPNDEVDAVRWLPLREADAVLSYDHDRALLRAAGVGLER